MEADQDENILHHVRESTAWVASMASLVAINTESGAAIEQVANKFEEGVSLVEWDFEGVHYRDGGPLTAQYLLVVDALNFCFWPDAELQYEDLAGGLRRSLQADAGALDAAKLAVCDGPGVRALVQWKREMPQEDERARLLRELGRGLLRSFGGQAAELVKAAKGSAPALVRLVTAHFPGFRDHSVYRGRQVGLYKRAQIFVGDLWGAFCGEGLGFFSDIDQLTIFADYLVPVVLRDWGILRYSQTLAAKVDSRAELMPGSEEEVEVRACCITAAEKLRHAITSRSGQKITSVQLDWWLWSQGFVNGMQHHRTLTIYY
eukprot:jgi/Mesen1/4944/ME000247S04237